MEKKIIGKDRDKGEAPKKVWERRGRAVGREKENRRLRRVNVLE